MKVFTSVLLLLLAAQIASQLIDITSLYPVDPILPDPTLPYPPPPVDPIPGPTPTPNPAPTDPIPTPTPTPAGSTTPPS
jgi:hypothetical protein